MDQEIKPIIRNKNQVINKMQIDNQYSLSNCISSIKKNWNELDQYSIILDNWKKIIGVELSKQCKPTKLEKGILYVGASHPQWRQALIYNRHHLKSSLKEQGILINDIKIEQYHNKKKDNYSSKQCWDKHPSRIDIQGLDYCKTCNSPSPKGELERWGKCIFCWRKNL
tara:strand:+ start:27 stop:530 length:504 start_codon:yes stop_codon:yes gene_type:complete